MLAIGKKTGINPSLSHKQNAQLLKNQTQMNILRSVMDRSSLSMSKQILNTTDI